MRQFLYILSFVLFASSGVLAQEDLVLKAAKSAETGDYEGAQLSIDKAILVPANADTSR